jgi:hypothetical protein
MRKKIFSILLCHLLMNSFCQSQTQSDCSKLKVRGYTQDFCDYDKKYSFKSIPFESNYKFIATQVSLIKNISMSEVYETRDKKITNWLNVEFDNSMLYFQKGKLVTVLLQIIGSEDKIKNNTLIFSYLNKKLTALFGKPDFISDDGSLWGGNRLYVQLHYTTSNGAGYISISSNKALSSLTIDDL